MKALSFLRARLMRFASPASSFASDPELAQGVGRRMSYLALFGTQTIGAAVLFWIGLRAYRQVLADSVSHEVQLWAIVGAISSIALMQSAYWVSYRLPVTLPRFPNALLGHAVLFLARMVYVLPTSIFGFLFIAQKVQFQIPIYQYLLIILGLFSLYCYVRELERLSRVFIA